jgi:S1-C subfamily serine protease
VQKAASVQKVSVGQKASSGPKVNPDSEASVEPVASPEPIASAELDEGSAADRMGLSMHALSDEEKRASGLPVGLMVDVATGPAAHAGIRPGDIVVSLDGELVESEDQAGAMEAKAKKAIAVLIQRHNVRSFVSIELR